MVALHETLGKVLRALQHGTGLRRSYDGHVLRAGVGLQVIVDAFHQRVFRTHHNHLYPLLGHKLLDGLEVVGTHVYVDTYVACARIAGGYKQLVTFLTLCYFPSQCVFASAAS